jgi:hypothetical protein
MVTSFLDHGVQNNSSNDKGRTPLMKAALCSRILLGRWADKEMKDRKGRMAIDFTAQSRKTQTKERKLSQ